MIEFVRITNPSRDVELHLNVHTYRNDAPPGEPGSLHNEVELLAEESTLVPLYAGAAITITQGGNRG